MTKPLPQRVRAHLSKKPWIDTTSPLWLGSPYHSAQWRVVLQPHEDPDRYPGATERTLNWDHPLPWGLSLMDAELTELREQCGRVMVGFTDSGELNSYPIETVPSFFSALTNMLEHLTFVDRPRTGRLGLGALGAAQVESYFERYCSGGRPLAGYWAERMDQFLRTAIPDAFNTKSALQFDSFGLPAYDKSEIDALKDRLVAGKCYRNDGSLSNFFIADAIGIPPKRLKCIKRNAFSFYLAQFHLTCLPPNAVAADRGAPRNTTPLPSASFAVSAASFLRRLQRICRNDPHLASLTFAQLDIEYQLAVCIPSRPMARTRTREESELLPVLRDALSFIAEFGESIHKELDSAISTGNHFGSDRLTRTSIVGLTGALLNIEDTSRRSSRRDQMSRNNTVGRMWLLGTLDVLTGCALFVALTLSCSRISEIVTLLKVDLLAGESGAHIRVQLRKTFTVMDKPVPDCVFDALILMSKISTTLVTGMGFTDARVLRRVFTRAGSTRVARFDKNDGYACIKAMWRYFAPGKDEVVVDLIRPHECRRFFAMSFFHSGDESSLPALSWFMGHEKLVDTWHYIREDMTGAEISELEAEMARKAISASALDANAEKLRDVVLKHFGATGITLVDPVDLQAYLEILHSRYIFTVVPIEVPLTDGKRMHLLTLALSRDENA